MTLVIGTARPEDESAWRQLWDGYLHYYKVGLSAQITALTWARIMDPASPLQGRFAWDGEALLGFALHHHHASTWVMGDDCYLEDLFVSETARGKGVGRALLDDLVALARAKGWQRLYWHTDVDNSLARSLYDSYVQPDGHIRYRMRL